MIKWRFLTEEVLRMKSAATGAEAEEIHALRLDSPWGKADRSYWLLAGAEMGQLAPGDEFVVEIRPVEPEEGEEHGSDS